MIATVRLGGDIGVGIARRWHGPGPSLRGMCDGPDSNSIPHARRERTVAR
ncbi:hypothetical protein ABZX40_33815 [Streptomyces sp. NPDC004610]